MKPSDTVTMAHVCDVVFGFYLDALSDMEGANLEDFEFAEHGVNCARSIAKRLGIDDIVKFREQAMAEGLVTDPE